MKKLERINRQEQEEMMGPLLFIGFFKSINNPISSLFYICATACHLILTPVWFQHSWTARRRCRQQPSKQESGKHAYSSIY
jgi:hypothetical protein